jgi:hypothetical protein
LFVAGMVGGYAGLCLLGPTDETRQPSKVAAGPIADPAPVPCSMQAWPNADRKCLEWTAPRAETDGAKTDATKIDSAKTNGAGTNGVKAAPQQAVAAAPLSDQRAVSPAQPSTVGMSSESRPAPAPAVVPPPAIEAPRTATATAEPTPASEPAAAPARTQSSKSRTAAHNRSKALAVVRGFGDNLNDVPLNAYASDGAPRRSVSRQSSYQDRYQDRYYAQRPRGWWW